MNTFCGFGNKIYMQNITQKLNKYTYVYNSVKCVLEKCVLFRYNKNKIESLF